MPNPMRMRATVEGDAVVVRVLMSHPEDTGLMKAPDGKIIPAHFIQSVICKNNDKTVLTCDWGTAISKNPFSNSDSRAASRATRLPSPGWTTKAKPKPTPPRCPEVSPFFLFDAIHAAREETMR